MKQFLPLLVIALGSQLKAEGERELIYLMRYGYMESKEGTAALQTEEGLRKQIKKAVMDFQVQFTYNRLCCIGKYEITGVCGP